MTLSELIAKLEGAEAGSRELDAHIWAAVLPTDGIGLDGYELVEGYRWENEAQEDGYISQYAVSGGEEGTRYMRHARRASPKFTTSLDAALSLVPEGWILDHLGDNAAGYTGKMKTIGAQCRLTDGEAVVIGDGADRPLSACISALRAIQHMEKAKP